MSKIDLDNAKFWRDVDNYDPVNTDDVEYHRTKYQLQYDNSTEALPDGAFERCLKIGISRCFDPTKNIFDNVINNLNLHFNRLMEDEKVWLALHNININYNYLTPEWQKNFNELLLAFNENCACMLLLRENRYLESNDKNYKELFEMAEENIKTMKTIFSTIVLKMDEKSSGISLSRMIVNNDKLINKYDLEV